MILFFNIKSLLFLAKNNPVAAIKLLKDFQGQKLMKYGEREKIKAGLSFLLNPTALLSDKVTDILYIYQYIVLAAKRDYSLYKLYGLKSLPLSYYPDINLESIKYNPLLVVTNSDIHFKYEEN